MSDDATSMILAALRRLEAGLGDLRTDLGDLRAKMVALRGGMMDRLENKLSGIRDDIGVNMHRADRVQEANDGTRNELRALSEVVMGMGRQIHRLQSRVDQLEPK